MRKLENGMFGALVGALVVLLLFSGTQKNVEFFTAREMPGVRAVEAQLREVPDAESPIGVTREFTLKLGDALDRDGCLAFYTVHQYVEVYIDGVLTAQWKPVSGSFIKTVGSNWTMLPLSREDRDKTVVVRLMPVYESVRQRQVEFLVGSELAIYRQRLLLDLPQLAVSILAILVGLVFCAISLYPAWQKNGGRRLAYLGSFAIVLGLWRLCDTRFTPFLWPEKPLLLYYTTLGAIMVGAVPLFLSVRDSVPDRWKKVVGIYCIGVSVLGLAEVAAQVFLRVDIRQALTLINGVLCVGAVLMIGMLLGFSHSSSGEGGPALIAGLLGGGVLGDVAQYYYLGNSSGLLFSLIALLACVVLTGVDMVVGYSRQEKELADSRTKIMLSQIQPHFLYNALCVIQDLCHDRAPDAEEATIEFSEFLRSNLDSLGATAPIPFERELKHARNYLSLEQRRFGEDLNVVYDIETENFSMPALSLEPIVENAVRYGCMQREEGGTVWISTREEKTCFCVTVKDDGMGFDVMKPKADGRTHIGIVNVRDRMEQMCGGSLRITSVPGEGTTAEFRIPKKN